jgi:16S rRNA (uracil1498-N3)-methyltransferase
MRISRIHVERPLASGDLIELPERSGRYLTQVLRLAIGDDFQLFNGDGHDYAAKLERRGRAIFARIGQAGPEEPVPLLEIELWIGISRGERMDLAIQKAVELGIHRLRPLFTERCQVRLDANRREKRLRHWQGVVISACEQSGRRRVPSVEAAGDLESALDQRRGTGLLLAPDAPAALSGLPSPGPRLTLLVGPEGGLSPTERGLAERNGFIPARLGPRILRTETAPLAALAAVQTLWGDFRD